MMKARCLKQYICIEKPISPRCYSFFSYYSGSHSYSSSCLKVLFFLLHFKGTANIPAAFQTFSVTHILNGWRALFLLLYMCVYKYIR